MTIGAMGSNGVATVYETADGGHFTNYQVAVKHAAAIPTRKRLAQILACGANSLAITQILEQFEVKVRSPDEKPS